MTSQQTIATSNGEVLPVPDSLAGLTAADIGNLKPLVISVGRTASHDAIGAKAGKRLTLLGLTKRPDGLYVHDRLPGLLLRRFAANEKGYGVRTIAMLFEKGHALVLGGKVLSKTLETGKLNIARSVSDVQVDLHAGFNRKRMFEYSVGGSASAYYNATSRFRTTTRYREEKQVFRGGQSVFTDTFDSSPTGTWEPFEVMTGADAALFGNLYGTFEEKRRINSDGSGYTYAGSSSGACTGLLAVSLNFGPAKTFFMRDAIKKVIVDGFPEKYGIRETAARVYDGIASSYTGEIRLGVYFASPTKAFIINPIGIDTSQDAKVDIFVDQSTTTEAGPVPDETVAAARASVDRTKSIMNPYAWVWPGSGEGEMWDVGLMNAATMIDVTGCDLGPHTWRRIVGTVFPALPADSATAQLAASAYDLAFGAEFVTPVVSNPPSPAEASAAPAQLNVMSSNLFQNLAAHSMVTDNYLFLVDEMQAKVSARVRAEAS